MPSTPPSSTPPNHEQPPWRLWLYETIFEADTPAGKTFDVMLLIAIVLSVAVVMLESVASIRSEYGQTLLIAEWFFTLLFTVEYFSRILCAPRPLRYIFSFYGVVDLLAILPTYLMVLHPGAQRLAVVRSLRLLRAFRIFRLAHLLSEATALRKALWMSRAKISVFLAVVVIAVTISGALMHLIEGPESGFTSIPESMYWAIVTMTTVGYGDKAPVTTSGRVVMGVWMVLSMITASSLTASIATALTLSQIDVGSIRELSDLESGRPVGVVAGTRGAEVARKRDLRVRSFESAAPALRALQEGRVQAVLGDFPILEYEARTEEFDLALQPLEGGGENYGFAIPVDAPWRHALDRAVLEVVEDEAYAERLSKYLQGS